MGINIKNFIIFIVLSTILITATPGLGQDTLNNYPTSSITPFFHKQNKIILTTGLNNFGLKAGISIKPDSSFFINLAIQSDDGHTHFDPLGFNFHERRYEEDLLSRTPSRMKYIEPSIGWILPHHSQKLEVITGAGWDYYNENGRFFVQFNWGNESRIINAGAFGRLNLMMCKDELFPALNMGMVGKCKIANAAIYNKFEYMLPWKTETDYMVPVFSVGIEYASKMR